MLKCALQGWAAAMLCAVLAACASAAGPAPTHAEVTAAVRAALQHDAAQFGPSRFAGADAGQATVTDYGCSPAPDRHGYLCQVKIVLPGTADGAQSLQRIVRMVHSADHWHANVE